MRVQATRPKPSTPSTNSCSGWSASGSSPTGSLLRPATGEIAGHFDQQSSRNLGRMCDFIAEHFLYDIDCVDIAAAADIHPKYAMNIFKKSTGMTLNEYVNLLRLSYAQAMLMRQDAKVLTVAMDSGFGSLSAFNKSFRKLAGMSPSDFRRVASVR